MLWSNPSLLWYTKELYFLFSNYIIIILVTLPWTLQLEFSPFEWHVEASNRTHCSALPAFLWHPHCPHSVSHWICALLRCCNRAHPELGSWQIPSSSAFHCFLSQVPPLEHQHLHFILWCMNSYICLHPVCQEISMLSTSELSPLGVPTASALVTCHWYQWFSLVLVITAKIIQYMAKTQFIWGPNRNSVFPIHTSLLRPVN